MMIVRHDSCVCVETHIHTHTHGVALEGMEWQGNEWHCCVCLFVCVFIRSSGPLFVVGGGVFSQPTN